MSVLKLVLQSWKVNIKKYFFSYKNGFFELFMIVNSPQLMIRNFATMPTVKLDKVSQKVQVDNLFLKVELFYLELYQNTTLILSEGIYKKNVLDVMLYDDRIPKEHYFLSLRTLSGNLNGSSTLVNGSHFSTNIWSLCKPGGVKNVAHFKNATEYFFTFYFTKEWLDEYLVTCNDSVRLFIEQFLESPETFLMWPRLEQGSSSDYSLFYKSIEMNRPVTELDKGTYEQETLKMFNEFASSINTNILHGDSIRISNENRLKLLKTEYYLSSYFHKEFPGVETIANQVGISPTGLKTGFNRLFGTTLFAYHRHQKMRIAFSLLKKNEDLKVKELAANLGYTNAAKFSAAFKEELGVLPSDVKSLP